jgi:hypothetical protein
MVSTLDRGVGVQSQTWKRSAEEVAHERAGAAMPVPAPVRTVLELQGAVGNRAVTRLLQRVKYTSTSAQGCKTQIDTGAADSSVVDVDFLKDYHGPQPHAARGDHGSAMVTFTHMVKNAVRFQDHASAIKNLRGVVAGLLSMPGMQQPAAAQLAAQALDQAAGHLGTAEKNAPDWVSIAVAMDMLIVARNMMPMSAITHATSTKGGGEGAKAGDLQHGETQFEKSGNTGYVLQGGDMANFWGLCEMRKRPVNTTHAVQTAAYIQQHIYTMRITYPYMFGPDDYDKLITYAFKTHWSESAGTAYKGFDAEKAEIEKILRKAVLVDKEPIQYVKNPSKRWSKEYGKGTQEFY